MLRAIIIILLLSQTLHAQFNLIADSSFENNKSIPLDYSAISLSTSWNSPSRATPDLFCKCADKKQAKLSRVNVPNNSMGVQEANTGKCYAGVFAVSHGYYREYLQTTLNGSLLPGKQYELNMYVSLSDYSPLAIDKIGVCFLNGSLNYQHSDAILDLTPTYINIEDEIGMETNDWYKLTLYYKAKGGENTLLVGAFGIKRLWKTGNTVPDNISSPIYKRVQRDAYYYFDDVSLREFIPEKIDTTQYSSRYFDSLKPDSTETVETLIVAPDTISNFGIGETLVFKNLLFKPGEAKLINEKNAELNIIAGYMKINKNLKIEITGHTDNEGDKQKNEELSRSRAKAVADYLIAKGINSANIKYNGLGSSKPIESNASEEGRKKNRRVEFVLLGG
jgi:OmpA-OmpF porin, OOP family